MTRPNLWFLLPSTDAPTGGINNCYRLCQIAEELGIKASVISERPYKYCDPIQNEKYWHPVTRWDSFLTHFDSDDIKEGDIVVQAELYPVKFEFDKKVRRVIYVQNWALMHEWAGWQEHIWTYNNWTHLTYCIESFNYKDHIHKERMPIDRAADIQDTRNMIEKKKVKWSAVTPYFDFENYDIGENDPNKILYLPRKMGNHLHKFKERFGDRLVTADNITPEELRYLYRKVGILVLPSPSEGLCFPIIEALLSGCSVVSWNCGAPEDYLIDGETAMMSNFGDWDSLMHKIEHLLSNPLIQRELSEKGRELVKTLYNKERTKSELYLAYHSAIRM